MATTKYRLAEQVCRILNGGDVPVATKVHILEAKIAVEQCINRLLKMDHLSVNMKIGEMIPNGASVATYDNILVRQYKTTSAVTLPAMPLKLPRGIGVYEVFNANDPDCLFIPLEMGQAPLLIGQPLLNNLLGQVGYTPYGDTLVFTKDLTIPNVDAYVSIRLVVMDISLYDDWSLLPVPADMEAQVIYDVVNLFRGEPVSDKLVDPGNNQQIGIPVQQQSQP